MRFIEEHRRPDPASAPPPSSVEPSAPPRPCADPSSLAPAQDFWRRALSGSPGPTPLVIDTHRNGVPSNSAPLPCQQAPLNPQLAADLAALSHQHNLPLEMLFHAAWAILLHRYSGESPLIFGATIRNPATNPTPVSPSSNDADTPPLPLCLHLDSEQPVLAWLTSVRDTWMGFAQFRHTPLEHILPCTGWPADTPPYHSAIQVEGAPPLRPSYPLHLTVRLTGDPAFLATYDPHRCDNATIARLLSHYGNLLAGMVADPSQPLWKLPLLSRAEQQQLLVDWNHTRRDYPQDLCIHQLFEQQAQKTPDAIAVVFDDQQLTYQELNHKANQLAHRLIELGVKPDTLVGLCVERSLEMVIGLLGVLKAGGAYVPLDPSYPADRLAFMLQDSAVPVLLTQQRLLNQLPPHHAHVLCLDADWPQIATHPHHNPDILLAPHHLAYVIYTSGSTGKPKGAMNTHHGIRNRLLWMQEAYQLDANDRILQKTPFSFDVSVWEFFWPLMFGARLVVARPEGHKDPAYLIQTILEQGITTLHFVPSMLHAFLEEPGLEKCVSLKRVFCSGEALPVEVQDRFLARSKAELHNLYGPTEAAVDVSFWKCDPTLYCHTVPIGRPIANTQLYILDAHLQPVPIGVSGELFIGGDGLARGYLNRPELTTQKFIPHPFDPNARVYRTGDLVRYLPDGNIEFLGRLDHQVKLRGFRIELGEIEATLARHPAVRQCVVILREDTPGDKRLTAYLVAADAQPDLEALRQHLKQSLPDYMVPSTFVFLPALPLSPNGKIDRKALPVPDQQTRSTSQPCVPPRTPTEQTLADIWSQVLGVHPIGIHDNFFDLGGHSLLATQVVARIRNTLHANLALRIAFERPTIADLAQAIESSASSESDSSAPILTPTPRHVPLPLSFAQQRLWFLDQLQPGRSDYNITEARRLTGPLNVAALQTALSQLVQRHEALRTTFVLKDGLPVQVITPPSPVSLAIVDLTHLPPNQQEAQVRQHVRESNRHRFDLSTGPLAHFLLLRLSDQEHVLVITLHHIISDGWTMFILAGELASLYTAAAASQAPPPAPTLQYADFAAWQRQWLSGPTFERQLDFWKKQLAGPLTPLQLPFDHPRPAIERYDGAAVELRLPHALCEAMRNLGQQEGASLPMLMLAAFKLLLHRLTGQTDILVGSPVAGRRWTETENIVGLFVNILVLRTDLAGDPPFRQLLQRVRDVALNAYAHQDLPFEKIVEVLHPDRDLSRHPIFEILFNYINTPTSNLQLPALRVATVPVEDTESKLPITFYIEEHGRDLVLRLVYQTALFAPDRMRCLLEQYKHLLEQIIAAPQSPIGSYSLLTPATRPLLPDPAQPLARNFSGTLLPRFAEQANHRPRQIAVTDAHEHWSYQTLDAISNRIANQLLADGLQPRSTVAIHAHRSAPLLAAILGTLKAGAAFVILDPAYPPNRLIQYLRIAQPHALIHLERAGPVPADLDQFVASLPHCRRLNLPATAAAIVQSLDHASSSAPAVTVHEDDPAYIQFTSGTTGTPKGILGTHRPIAHFLDWHTRTFHLTDTDRFTFLSGLAHDPALRDLFTPLWLGATLCIPDPDWIFDRNKLTDWLHQQRPSVIHLTPALARLLTAGHDSPANTAARLPSLCYAFFGGDQLTRQDVESLRATAPAVQCVNFYGTTETPQAMGYYSVSPDAAPTTDPQAQQRTIPVGRGIDDAQLLVLNPAQTLAGVGELGEIHIRTPHLTQGYLHDDELTRARFLANPFTRDRDDRLYRTGDLGRYRPDGSVELVSRADMQLKIRGYRIEPAEISAILNQHPNVRQSAIAAIDTPHAGKRLVAYLVADPINAPSNGEWRTFLQKHLPEHMIPSAYVVLDRLPLTPNGKLDHRALPAPDFNDASDAAPVAPRDALELQLVQIWEQILGVHPIGIHDSFFDLGGHSLLAVQLFAQIEKQCGRNLPLAILFQRPTIAHLADALRQDGWTAPSSLLVPIRTDGAKTPLFLLPGRGGHVFTFYPLAQRLGPDQPVYGLQLPGADHHHAHLKRVEDLAAHFLREIQTIQPQGPYCLGGYSFGGKVAFEMARQLHAAGHRVALVALFDSWGPGYPRMLPLTQRLMLHLQNLTSLSRQQKLRYLADRMRNLLHRVRPQAPRMVSVASADSSVGHAVRQSIQANYQSWRNYTPGVYPGRLILFPSIQKPNWLGASFDDPTLGWGKLAAQGVEIHPIPGEHLSVFKDANVQVLADLLRTCLQSALTPPTTAATSD